MGVPAGVEALAEAGEHRGDGNLMYTGTVLVVGSLYFLWYYQTFNSLTAFRNAVEQTWSNIDVELQRRFDLINNLVAVVKGYGEYEKGTYLDVVAARAGMHQQVSVEEAVQMQQQITSAVSRLFALAESYPDLKADQQYLKLQSELAETENRIAERRTAYNNTVNLYLNKRLEFPSSVIASAHSFAEKAYFDLPDEQAKESLKVSLR